MPDLLSGSKFIQIEKILSYNSYAPQDIQLFCFKWLKCIMKRPDFVHFFQTLKKLFLARKLFKQYITCTLPVAKSRVALPERAVALKTV